MGSQMFDFGSQSTGATAVTAPVITYKTFSSQAEVMDEKNPIMYLSDAEELPAQMTGKFGNPGRRTAFLWQQEKGTEKSIDIVLIDDRFPDLLRWLGENSIPVSLNVSKTGKGYAVHGIRETESFSDKLSAGDGFLQYTIGRILESHPAADEEETRDDDSMKLTSLQSLSDFLSCAGRTLPANIRAWARRNLAVARSNEVSPEERRHAMHALSIMLGIQWKSSYFASIDPTEARRILDEELYGMESVKQRIIETIIQINRTHTLPAYGLLLCGPAGTGKSQVAYAVARILKLPWTTLDMSSIHDAEQLTGSSRVYANAKPGSIMEAFALAGSSNLVVIINELDKADSKTAQGNPADALLTLLDSFGFTDNYMECVIPTGGVYPIATANDKSRISEPLMTRFAVIDIPDYTAEEKKAIFLRYSLPKVLKRMGMSAQECRIEESGAEEVVRRCMKEPGVRDLEQAAEHLAANALYRIETQDITGVSYDAEDVAAVLD